MLLRVIHREKKGRALKAGTFGCLKGAYTINVTQGSDSKGKTAHPLSLLMIMPAPVMSALIAT